MPHVYIGAIGRSVGEMIDLKDVSLGKIPIESRTRLLQEGFLHAEINKSGVVDAARQATESAIRQSHIRSTDIDFLIVSTESAWESLLPLMEGSDGTRYSKLRDEFLHTFIEGIGLTNATIFSNAFSACGNSYAAVSIACAFLRSGQYRNALLVNSDRLRREHYRANHSYLVSDISTATVITSTPSDIFISNHWSFTVNELIYFRREPNSQKKAIILAKAFRALRIMVSKVIKPIVSYDFIVLENYGETTVRIIAACLQVHRDKIVTPSRKLCGHAFSSDLFLSLEMLRRNTNRDEKILMISIGTSSIGVIEVELNRRSRS